MSRRRTLKLLVTPSLFSGAVCVVSALAVLGVAAWSYISHYELFYDDLFGRYGLVTALTGMDTQNMIAIFRTVVFEHLLTYNVLIFVAAVIAGLTVYVFLEGFEHFVVWAKTLFRSVQNADPNNSQAVTENLSRLSVRVLAIIGWALYAIFFTNVLIPTSLLLMQLGIDAADLGSWTVWPYLGASALLFMTSLHVHVVFARLSFLRLRLLGGYDVQIEEQQPKI